MRFVLHVVWVVRLNRVDDDLLWKLHRKPVLVDRDLFDVVTASNLDSRLGHEVLNDHISHQFAIRISFLVQAMHLVKFNFERRQCSVVGASEN